MRRTGSSSIVLLVVMLGMGIALGVGVSLALFVPTTPAILRTGTPATSVPVTLQQFRDPLPVDVHVALQPRTDILVMRGGTITAIACTAGDVWRSGTSSVSIDGQPLISLATRVPLWRDLSVGSRGPDARAVEEELDRLGYSATIDGSLSREDMRALTALAKDVGAGIDGVLTRDAVLWLPGSEVDIATCGRELGSVVGTGESVAQVSGGLVLSPVVLPRAAVPGKRLLEVFEEPLPLGDSGELPDDVSSSAIRNSIAFQQAVAEAPDSFRVTLRARAVLEDPVSVASVPATSVLVADDQTACVFSGSAPHVVRIVGSEFGNTFVLFDDDASLPESVDSSVPKSHPPCG